MDGDGATLIASKAVLFKVFQQVFDAPRDAHSEELRRLGIFVLRKFVETAPKNPKIYAELFFYKTIRDANELETGYCDDYDAGTKGTWTEEQKTELRFLFQENQNNPQTDQDVIDWILENLIDKTRTRRGVLKMLRELGLQFKAPTKKSTAASSNKDLWQLEEDDELKELYDEHRLEDDCLQKILDAFGERRTKNHIIKRMIQLHLIADKSEILPAKPRKKKSNKDSAAENEGGNAVKKSSAGKNKAASRQQQKRKIIRTPLDVGTVRSLLNSIDEKFSDALTWLKESFADAADDTDAPSEEDDGIPLLPLSEVQKDAMDDNDFQKLLLSFGVQPPISGMENYWRIPVYLNAADLKLRERILDGEEVDQNELNEEDEAGNEAADEATPNQDSSGEESEEDYLDTFMNKRREQMNNLLYSKSDDEDEQRTPLVAKERPTSTSSKNPDEDRAHEASTFKKPSQKGKQKPDKMNLFDMVKGAEDTPDDGEDDFNSEDYRKRLAELGSTDSESDNEAEATIIENTSNRANRSRVRNNRIESDSDEEAGDASVAATIGGGKKRARSTDDEGDNNESAPPHNEDDDDELFIKRKELPTGKTKLGEEPKRRRIAIIDDDDDEDGVDF